MLQQLLFILKPCDETVRKLGPRDGLVDEVEVDFDRVRILLQAIQDMGRVICGMVIIRKPLIALINDSAMGTVDRASPTASAAIVEEFDANVVKLLFATTVSQWTYGFSGVAGCRIRMRFSNGTDDN